MNLVIHAPNIHQGGGRSLLLALLHALPSDQSCIAILDARLDDDSFPVGIHRVRVKPTIVGRLLAENILRKCAKQGDRVLCFGNLPPLFRLRAGVFLYLQNRYLSSRVSLKGFAWKARCRIYAERLWLASRLGNVDSIIVQTATLQREVLKAFNRQAIIKPFMDSMFFVGEPSSGSSRGASTCLLYVASGEAHKNHARLLEAWGYLASENLHPELLLTLNPADFERLKAGMEGRIPPTALNIKNVGPLAPHELRSLYNRVDGLIYPSTMESFGLPLLEARQARLPVIASERDYVRDVMDPDQTFDPESAVSIARAVKRFLGKNDENRNVESPHSFLDWLVS